MYMYTHTVCTVYMIIYVCMLYIIYHIYIYIHIITYLFELYSISVSSQELNNGMHEMHLGMTGRWLGEITFEHTISSSLPLKYPPRYITATNGQW